MIPLGMHSGETEEKEHTSLLSTFARRDKKMRRSAINKRPIADDAIYNPSQ